MNEIRITREELYNLVWSTPMLTLSKKYDISDVGLRKTCIRMNIPLPPPGYWVKLKFGKRIVIKPLPEKNNRIKEVYLKLRKEVNEGPISALNRLQKEIENDLSLKWRVPHNLSKPDNLIVAARKSFNEKNNYSGYMGVITCSGLSIMVSPKNVGRALRFMDTLIKLLRQREHVCMSEYHKTYAIIEGERIQIWLNEKLKKVVKDPHWTQYHANGILSFRIYRITSVIEFVDGKQTIEEQIPRILAKLELLGKKLKEDRIAFEKRQAEQREKERIKKELEQRQEKELADFKALLLQANRWRQATMLRGFIESVKEKSLINGSISEEMKNWYVWAMKKTDWYDPFIECEDELLKEIDRESLSFIRKR